MRFFPALTRLLLPCLALASAEFDGADDLSDCRPVFFFQRRLTPDRAAPPGAWESSALRAHNVFRCMHDALPLQWSEALSALSREAALRLAASRGPHPAGPPPTAASGENVFAGGARAAAASGGAAAAAGGGAEEAVRAWYAEIREAPDPSSGKIDSFDGEAYKLYPGGMGNVHGRWGNYTQVVWGDTQAVGCAAAKDVLVCRYWPAGNVHGKFAENVRPLAKSEAACQAVWPTPLELEAFPAGSPSGRKAPLDFLRARWMAPPWSAALPDGSIFQSSSAAGGGAACNAWPFDFRCCDGAIRGLLTVLLVLVGMLLAALLASLCYAPEWACGLAIGAVCLSLCSLACKYLLCMVSKVLPSTYSATNSSSVLEPPPINTELGASQTFFVGATLVVVVFGGFAVCCVVAAVYGRPPDMRQIGKSQAKDEGSPEEG